MKDIYGSREEIIRSMELQRRPTQKTSTTKLESLQSRWEVLCPEIFAWFNVKRKSPFLESVTQSSRENSDINGLYYQNDFESKPAVEKRNQYFKQESILATVSNLHAMIKREENDGVRAIYGARNYVLSSQYKNFQVESHVWHSWNEDRKRDLTDKFRR